MIFFGIQDHPLRQDSNLMMLVQDIRNISLADEDTDVSMGLVLLLDGLDEASSRRLFGAISGA